MEKEWTTVDDQSPHEAVPTSQYDYAQLADIYNQARVDYIVPMPMNARRMEEYVVAYDIDLDASLIAMDTEDQEPNGICMLGIRDHRTWITRLGVIPERRRRRSGQYLMEKEIEESLKRGKSLVQLEVIKGNEPAYRLFTKLGFKVTRELLIIRRPPAKLTNDLQPHRDARITTIPDNQVFDYLGKREEGAAWTEETSSLRNAGNMKGLTVQLNGEDGWVVFQRSPFQLSHFVLSPNVSEQMTETLIAAVHSRFPLQDTKIENVPSDHHTWDAFQKFGYFEAFSRIEMVLDLNK